MNSKLGRFFIAVIGGVVSLSLLQYLLTNALATRGGELSTLLAQESVLREEHEHLSTQVAQYTSLTRVQKEGERLGLVPAQRYTYLSPTDLAQKPHDSLMR